MSSVVLIGSENNEDEEIARFRQSYFRATSLAFLAITLVLGTIAGIYLLVTEDFNGSHEHAYSVISNGKWGHNHGDPHLVKPAMHIFVTDTSTEPCSSHEKCFGAFENFTSSRSRVQHETLYNFLIGGDGRIYEGLGWNHPCEKPKDCSDNSISIAFIGSFDEKCPDRSIVKTVINFLKSAQNNSKLSKCFMTEVPVPSTSNEKPKLCLLHVAAELQSLTAAFNCR